MTGSLRRRVALVLIVLDALIVFAAVMAGYGLRFFLEVGAIATHPVAPIEPYLEAAPVVVLVFLVVLRARGLHGDLPLFGIDIVERTFDAVTLATLAVLALTFFYRDFSYSRGVLAITWTLSSCLLPLPRLALLARRRARHAAGKDLAPALVVGSGAGAAELAARLSERALFGLDLQGIVLPEAAPDPAGASAALPVLGRTRDLEAVARARSIREVLVTDDLPKLELLDVIATCERLDVEPRLVPAVHDLCITAHDLTQAHGVPFISIREQRAQIASLALKRAFDLVVSLALIVLFAPVFVITAIAIRATSRGPAFFTQPRVGENGRVFRMVKFRSMVADAEARLQELVDLEALKEPVFKLQHDPRVTPIGRFLRVSSLDELPQLWNVVKGEMSLVGPRPEEEAVVKRYDRHQLRRLKAKPGMTGLQQIEARGVDSLEERIRLDVLYIRRRTFLFDLWILARTPRAVLSAKGAR